MRDAINNAIECLEAAESGAADDELRSRRAMAELKDSGGLVCEDYLSDWLRHNAEAEHHRGKWAATVAALRVIINIEATWLEKTECDK